MASEPTNDDTEFVTSADTETKKTKKKKSILSRIWDALFRVHRDDFQKRLEHISKEEASVLARITKRSHRCRRMTRHFILISVLIEVVAVGYAVMTTRSLNLNWQMRALRVLPMFLLPALSFITYSTLRSFSRMRDRKDHKILEKLRAERQAKIDELKEKTNYYITQQLIQRYDPDPAAKAAAATVLASKLGADSGLKVYVEDDANPSALTGKSNDVELASNTAGLRHRKQPHKKTSSIESGPVSHPEGGKIDPAGFEVADLSAQHQFVVEHHPQAGLTSNDGGWIARLAALLVGEDPTQSYALICGNCHMHNGLARKEDFPYVTYYCPHCNALNRSKQSDDRVSVSDCPTPMSLDMNMDNAVVGRPCGSTVDKVSPSASPVADYTVDKVSSSASPVADATVTSES
ncbi:Protein of unknown function (DUF2296 [Striga hermonthica]|uniref:Lunapark zinc ribbon domain-containing protein n=1 Tax=Striga hermonthica TaxID=68872 RepID=A0A9N7N0X5_STRHE|nr:Protein of unknown function (DUF2296 [Striga hermonthica]